MKNIKEQHDFLFTICKYFMSDGFFFSFCEGSKVFVREKTVVDHGKRLPLKNEKRKREQ